MDRAINVAVVFCLLTVGFSGASFPITKRGSAYDGLVIALHDSIPEDETYIDRVKDMIQKSSEFLYNATDGAAFFRQVTIAVPQSWNHTANVSAVFTNHYPDSHVRIVPPQTGASQIAAPFTMQPGGCGEPGMYIEVDTDFLTADDAALKEMYGTKEKMLVHEWAHFRFGVFDEYGIPGHNRFPLFYFNDGFLEVSTCTKDIGGWMWSESSGELCDVFEDKVSSDCIFYPDENQQNAEVSIMSVPIVSKVNRFCNKSEGNRSHNWRAPTKQNVLCEGRSAWEVISAHPDIAQMGPKSSFEKTKFTVVRLQEQKPRYVLVLDVSTSMGYFDGRPMEIMKQACSFFIGQQIPDESYLGIVSFSTSAKTEFRLVPVNNATRTSLSAAVRKLTPTGNTAIGQGLSHSLEVLKKAEQRTEGASIILLTDGAENVRPHIDQVMPQLLAAKVRVLTIALGPQASTKLEKLAIDTQGKSYLFPNLTSSSTGELNQILQSTITVQGDVQVERIELMNNQYILQRDTPKSITMVVEKELGKNAVFSISSKDIKSITFILKSPSGIEYNQKSEEFQTDYEASLSTSYKLRAAQDGVWNVTLKSNKTGDASVDLSVVSEPTDNSVEPVRVTSWINATIIHYPAVPKIFAQVTKGRDVVMRANVVAIITAGSKRTKIDLKDDGKGSDVLADDGIYSGYFTNFKVGDTRYTVVAEVQSTGQALVKRTNRRVLYAAPSPNKPAGKKEQRRGEPANKFSLDRFRKVDVDPDANKTVGSKVDDFTRTTNAGSFQIENLKDKDLIKPNPVTDLIVLSTGRTERGLFVSLQWTAPGDDMDAGNATRLELRGGNSSLSRQSFFTHGYLFEKNETVLEGSLDSVEGGTVQNVTVLLPSELELTGVAFDVLFTIRGVDKAENVGDMGNVASAHFGYTIKEKSSDENKSDGVSTGVVIGIAVGVVALVAIMCGVVFYRKCRK